MPQPCFNLAMADSACSVETIRSMIGVYEKRWPAFLVGSSNLDFECPLRRAISVGRTDVLALLLERGCPVQGKSQHGDSECVSSPLALTVGLIKKMHADDLQESRLPLILDQILSHPWFRAGEEALKTLDRVFRSADLAGGWQDVMALIVRDLVSRSSPGALDMTIEKVRCLMSLAISWNTHGPGSSEDEGHQRLRELLPGKEQEEERQGERLEEETAEDDYHHALRALFQADEEESAEDDYYYELRALFQVDQEEQEEWHPPYVSNTFIPDFEAINLALGQIVSGDHSSPDVNTSFPAAPVVAIV
ncbi:hypothetical protein PG991_013714 [Apiospora marii]|uniref:Protein kinase domain-containing protein n=2 Tax=Apiospora marii TaxID=335849 RepID=A0ABR1R6Y5_9PEZI